MTPGYLRDTELAARMFRQEDEGALPKVTAPEGKTVAEAILDPAASAGSVDILRMALERIAWPRDDPRWWGILASPLCFWNHIPWIYSEKWDLDRSTYLPCFAMVLDRCDANLKGPLRHHRAAFRRGVVRLGDARGTRGIRAAAAGSRREDGRARRLAAKHSARVGVPLGKSGSRGASAAAGRRPGRGGRGRVGNRRQRGQRGREMRPSPPCCGSTQSVRWQVTRRARHRG